MSSVVNIWDEYKKWLLDLVDISNKRVYSKLFDFLHNREFEYCINRDLNRVDDGMDLRIDFMRDKGVDIIDKGDPTILEVLIGLAIRVDTEYIGDPAKPNPGAFFWEMCCNLGLDQFTNRNFDWEHIDIIIDAWMSREFDYDGEGSIFPLKNPKRDQREIEIWSQLQEYLSENYR